MVAIVGFLDDCKGVPALKRVLCHILAALIIMVLIAQEVAVPWWMFPVGLFLLVWSTNLFNFMDGTDGLAAIEAVFVLGVGGLLMRDAGAINLPPLMWLLSASLLGFLCFNWPKAKVFMGDVGSGFLGFVIAAIAIACYLAFDLSPGLWMILYAVFLFDSTVTLVRRVLHGDRWYEAHKLHAYQRLHQAGWSHAKILIGLIIVNLMLSAAALWAGRHPEALLWVDLAVFVGMASIYLGIERVKPMYSKV
jgi:Fuc2NAc and GlcNAc transferase